MTLKQILNALLFATREPLTPRAIRKVLREAEAFEPTEEAKEMAQLKEGEILNVLGEIRDELARAHLCYALEEVAGGFQLVTRPEYSLWVRHLFDQPRPNRLSQPALETLAIVAYRQPISRAEIEAVRGVAVDGVLNTLVERGFIKATGRAEVPGRPLIYETTELFLKHFGIRTLEELPNARELRRPSAPETGPADDAMVKAPEQTEELPFEKQSEEVAAADRPAGS